MLKMGGKGYQVNHFPKKMKIGTGGCLRRLHCVAKNLQFHSSKKTVFGKCVIWIRKVKLVIESTIVLFIVLL